MVYKERNNFAEVVTQRTTKMSSTSTNNNGAKITTN